MTASRPDGADENVIVIIGKMNVSHKVHGKKSEKMPSNFLSPIFYVACHYVNARQPPKPRELRSCRQPNAASIVCICSLQSKTPDQSQRLV